MYRKIKFTPSKLHLIETSDNNPQEKSNIKSQDQLSSQNRTFNNLNSIDLAPPKVPTSGHFSEVSESKDNQTRLSTSLEEIKTKTPKQLLVQSIQMIKGGQRKYGIQLLKLAIIRDPTFFRAHFALGNEFVALNDVEQAQKYFQNALNINPDHILSLVALANLHSRKEEYHLALLYYERAIKIDPNNMKALTNRAFVIANLRPAIAMKYIEDCFEILSQIDEPLRTQYQTKVLHGKAICLEKLGQSRAALLSVEQIFRLNPTYDRLGDLPQSLKKQVEQSEREHQEKESRELQQKKQEEIKEQKMRMRKTQAKLENANSEIQAISVEAQKIDLQPLKIQRLKPAVLKPMEATRLSKIAPSDTVCVLHNVIQITTSFDLSLHLFR